MSKYIDAEKLKAEIERLRDEYTDIAIDSHYGTVNANHVVADLEQLLSLIDSLQQEQPSLPSNLDEAAVQAHIQMEESGEEMTFLNIFKAGAKWMAEQGETHNGMVCAFNGDGSTRYISGTFLSPKNFELADKVIIQIRKKEE